MADLHAFVDALSDWFASRESAAGCLMVNSMIEFGGSQERIVDEACRYTERFRIAATAAMRRAVERGEVEAGNLDARVDLMVGMVLALNVAARSGVPGLPGRLVEALRVQVASWETG